MGRRTSICITVTLLSILTQLAMFPINGFSEVPHQINFQGHLTDGLSNPLDGDYYIVFSIYDVSTGGTALWWEAQTVSVTYGIYNVQIGQNPTGNPFPNNLFEGNRWLGVTVETDAEMAPRQLLTSTAFAMRAEVADSVTNGVIETIHMADNAVTNEKVAAGAITADKIDGGTGSGVDADKLDGQDASYFAPSSHVHNEYGDITGVIAGTGLDGGGTSGDVSLAVEIPFSLSGSGIAVSSIILGRFSDSTMSGVGVRGEHAAGPYGELGEKYYGVFGYSPDSQGTGVVGQSIHGEGMVGSSMYSYGVEGHSTNSLGVKGTSYYGHGVYGETYDGEDKSGVYGFSDIGIGVTGRSDQDYGVIGWTGATEKSGVYGHSTFGTGVYGETSGDGVAGVWGKSISSISAGVFGEATNGIAVKGRSVGGTGVSGSSETGNGVNGYSSGWNDSHGVYGEAVGGYGMGVRGQSSGGHGRGIHGACSGNNGIGVFGWADGISGTGVHGYGVAYDFYAAGPGINYGADSSIRWKQNIEEIDSALEMVMQMRGVYFDWDSEHGGKHDMGFVAEEVGQYVPEIVVYEENGEYASGMDYGKMTPILLQAIKEQQGIISELRAEIENLRDDIRSIKAGR